MDDAAIAYLKEVHDKTRFFGTWPPGLRVEVGEVGRIGEDGVYRRSSDLGRAGIAFETQSLPYQDVQFATEGGVEIAGEASVKTGEIVSAVTDVSGALTISFTSGDAVLVLLRDVQMHRVVDEEQLRRDMMTAWNAEPRRLDTDNVVITRVLEAKSGALAMSAESAAHVEATSSVSVAPGKIQLADVHGRVSFVSSANTRFAVSPSDDDPPLTPLFEMLYFAKNRQWWRFWRPIISAQTRGPQSPPDLDDSSDPGEVLSLPRD
ncbi:hypothetical protein [Agromyces bracchium]|uniref:Uncharacterized protein n=1 Tax=Agromyces bracchium TaxID=88376 RepID=A0A6I3M952_9MICO|nr:hypothetical protein [Agromyces bracchium]MTH69824.1 hypothetical protein [Agromyces bracchium]